MAIQLDMFADSLNVLGAGNGRYEGLDGGPVKRSAIFAQGMPADEPVSAGIKLMKGFAGADDADSAGLRAEGLQGIVRDIRQFEAVVPVGKGSDHLLMQTMQGAEGRVIQRAGHHHSQIQIADMPVKIAGDQRAIEIDADEPAVQNRPQTVGQLLQDGADGCN